MNQLPTLEQAAQAALDAWYSGDVNATRECMNTLQTLLHVMPVRQVAHWTYRRYESPSVKGHHILTMPHGGETHGEHLAYLGDGEAAEVAAKELCIAHNACIWPLSRGESQ